MKIATIKQFLESEGLEDRICPSCGSALEVGTRSNGVPYVACDNCDYSAEQMDDYGLLTEENYFAYLGWVS